ncbi:MAG: ATP-binding protein [Phycisphaerae bacterium]
MTGDSRHARHFRVGLQFKSALILAFLVVGVATAGGWLYMGTARLSLRSNDYQHASWIGQAFSLAAQQDLLDGRNVALQRLVGDCIRRSNVRYISLLDSDGRILASACQHGESGKWASLNLIPPTVADVYQKTDSVLVYAKPVVYGAPAAPASAAGADGPDKPKVVGAIRMALDTSATADNLARVQQRIGFIAAVIVLGALPIGYLLVWRVILQPVRHLAAVTGRLASGDYTCRARLTRNDELGELSSAFDAMAEEVARGHDQLLNAKDRLEKKVAERTSELQRLNARLREEMVEKEDFLRAVSHDLNAPLRNIAGMITMIMMKYKGVLPEEVAARLERIAANSEMETSLISDLLELSRIKSRPQNRQVVSIEEVLDALKATFEFDLRERNIELTVKGPMPRLYVEKNRIRQVFQNLLDNAIKYMHRARGGRIEIGYRNSGDAHVFSVADNGPGIPPAEHQRIFYVFRRAQDPNVAKVEGKGVGLAAVKGIVSNYEGSAWVESAPGKGATFYVSLGLSCTRPPVAARPATDAAEDELQPAEVNSLTETD